MTMACCKVLLATVLLVGACAQSPSIPALWTPSASLPSAAGDDPFAVPLPPVLLPWPADNSTHAYQGGSPVAEMNIARVTIGPCTFRALHLHYAADELMYVMSGELQSFALNPSNNSLYSVNVTAGHNTLVPKGWPHYQFNPTCETAETFLAFNAKAVGTVNFPQAMAAVPGDYFQATYGVKTVLSPVGMWVMDEKCLRRCNRKRK